MTSFFRIVALVVLGAVALPYSASAQESLMQEAFENAQEQKTAPVEQIETDEVATTAPVPLTRTEPILYFFFSPTCPHCHKEQAWLDKMEEKYPALDIRRYDVTDSTHHQLMRDVAAEHGATQYLGAVPLTFVHGEHVIGYQNDETTGATIEAAIQAVLGIASDTPTEGTTAKEGISVPFIGSVNPADYSLPILAILLGFLDGFNVCSLGALVLIIGLTLKLQRRRAIILFGGTFILTTALVYGALIVVWYQIFGVFADYMNHLKVGVALLSLGGGLYFLKEYLKMLKRGATCELQESSLVQRMTERTGRAFEDAGKFLSVLGAVLAFAVVVTVVEFPCSAAVPVVFAGILVDAGLSTLAYLSHIGLFVLFYMLDELIIFGIAAYKLKLWMTNGTFTKWAVLGEALILLGIGVWYLGAILGVV